MSVGFGFSAGDFISALELVATVVDALRESGLARTEYHGLVNQLDLLKTALHEVNNVELDASQYTEKVALQQAAAQCQRTIDDFWRKNITKYEPSLKARGSGSKFKDGWMKAKWALYQKEELAKFKADLVGHTESINLILATVHIAATRIQRSKSDKHHRSLAGKVQDSYFGCMQRMTLILERISTGIEQGKQLLEMTAKIIQTNVQIFQIVLNIQNIITRIPGQIERQQPVYFIDALGRHTPFYLEFITSAESLTYVLQNNFRNIGPGATKIKKGEFAIQDSTTKRDIDLARAWEVCFCPGQQVAMSMLFTSTEPIDMNCPKCNHYNGDALVEDEDFECGNCKMVYRHSACVTTVLPTASLGNSRGQIADFDLDGMDFQTGSHDIPASQKRKSPHDEDDEMGLFRRVRIRNAIVVPATDSRQTSPATDLDTPSPSSPRSIEPTRLDVSSERRYYGLDSKSIYPNLIESTDNLSPSEESILEWPEGQQVAEDAPWRHRR